MIGVKQRADHSELSEFMPQLLTVARSRSGDRGALFERVLLAQKVRERAGQHPALFCMLKIHITTPGLTSK
jgi:hypothetical protein